MRLLPLLALAFIPMAIGADNGGVIVYGATEGHTTGWALSVAVPGGWASDCCELAKDLGANLLLYRTPWANSAEGVMVLEVWKKDGTLDEDWIGDRTRSLKGRLGMHPSAFPVVVKGATCRSTEYEDRRVDDYVVFCDPGGGAHFRYSWSMQVRANDPERPDLVAAFKQVVASSSYMRAQSTESTGG